MKNFDSNYIHISGWMRSRLKLKGNELIVFALIYGFSQDGASRFSGSLSYVERWTGASRPTVIKTLKSLVEKGLVERIEKSVNGVFLVDYVATSNLTTSKETLLGGSKEILPRGSKETLLHNTNKDKSTSDSNKPDGVSSEVWEDWKKLRKTQRAPITPLVLKTFTKEGEKAGMSLEEVLTFCVTNGYRGFKADWVKIRYSKPIKKTEAERNFDKDFFF